MNDGTNEFNIILSGECYIQISSMDESLDADNIDISIHVQWTAMKYMIQFLNLLYIIKFRLRMEFSNAK